MLSSVTTDHISPAGGIKPDNPAGDIYQNPGLLSGKTLTPTVRGVVTMK